MRRYWWLQTFISFFFMLPLLGLCEENPISYSFSGTTAEENKVILQGAGFGAYPAASVSFGEIPIDNTFNGATDGKGVIITAKPGEGIMIFGQKIASKYSAMARCSVRTDKPTASVIIATIGDEPDVFVSQNMPNNKSYFTGQYLRLQTFCVPPQTGFQPVIQIINTGTETLKAYIDNLEIYSLLPNRFYNSAFLDGDETDPTQDKISQPADEGPGVANTGTLSIPIGTITKVLNVQIDLVLIPAGTFMMGSPASESGRENYEGTQHAVTITKSFYMGKYEVTQLQWETVMGTNPSSNKSNINNPVEKITWSDCQLFITKLNALGQGKFRLPTEAEWEYACRAGTTTRFYWGDDLSESLIGKNAWYSGNSSNPVGLKLPNAFGLYDMSGNVIEYCEDDWHTDYNGAPTDGSAWINSPRSTGRVGRGGCWWDTAANSRSAKRAGFGVDNYKDWNAGFRLVREYP